MKRYFLWLALCLTTSQSALAEQGDARGPHLSDRGRTLVAGTVGGGWSNDDSGPWVRSYYRWWLSVEPSVLYFVRNRVGLGGYAGVTTGHLHRQDDLSGDVGVQALFDFRLGERTSIYMMPSLGYRREHSKFVLATPAGTQSLETRRGAIQTAIFVPLIYHPVPNVAIGFGPSLAFDLWFQNDSDAVYYGSGFVPLYSQRNKVRLSLGTFIGASF